MKAFIVLSLLCSISAFANQQQSIPVPADEACELQIVKAAPASLVIVCGNTVYANEQLETYTAQLQQQAEASFASRLVSPTGVNCQKTDTDFALVVVCKRK